MRAHLIGFTVAGLAGGLLAGLYDGFAAHAVLSASERATLLAGTVGINLVLGALLGPLVGALAPLVPRGFGLVALARAGARRVWSRDGDGLYERCDTVAAMSVGWVLIVVAVDLLRRAGTLILARVHTPEFAALGVTVAAILVAILGLGVAVPLRTGLARALEVVVRRWPRLTPISHPLMALVICLGALVVIFLDWTYAEWETWSALDLRPVVGAGLLLGGLLAGGALLRLHVRGVSAGVALAASLAGILLGASAFSLSLTEPAARFVLGERTGLSRAVLRVARAPFDADGDGFARVLGGGDCDDEDPAIFPGALEIAGDDIDQDCDGGDLEARPAVVERERALGPAVPAAPADPGASPARIEPPYNLVLILIDAVRADHVGAYGYPRSTTPALDALAAESVVFLNAYSTSAKTPTALPSMLSGRYPSELARNADHFAIYAPENIFFPEVLAGAGYLTVGFPSHWYLEPPYGLAQGFERWVVFSVPGARMEQVATAEPVVTRAQSELGTELASGERPYLLFVYVLDPHKSYIAHEGFESFGDSPIDRYDGEIRYADHWIGELLATLRARPDWDRTAVVVTSDHGEAFGEHGYRFHGFGLHEDQLRVPLIIRVPEVPAREVRARVSLVDLAPTLLDLAGIGSEAPERVEMGLRGRSLVPALDGHPLADRPIYAEIPRAQLNSAKAALIRGSWKLHYNAEGDFYQLFDLGTDPGEQTDLFRSRPQVAAEMKAALQGFRAAELAVRAPAP